MADCAVAGSSRPMYIFGVFKESLVTFHRNAPFIRSGPGKKTVRNEKRDNDDWKKKNNPVFHKDHFIINTAQFARVRTLKYMAYFLIAGVNIVRGLLNS